MNRKEAEKDIVQLREEIRRHDRLYYQDAAPIISDREYDRLYKELVDLETQFPDLLEPDSPTQRVGGKPLQAFAQIQHRAPMLSLDNTYSEEEVVNFYKRITRLLPDEKIPVVIEPKVDGVAVSVMYEKGRLKYAATRGDGLVGDRLANRVGINHAHRVDRKIGHPSDSLLLEPPARVEDGALLRHRGDDVVTLLPVHLHDALDCEVVRLGSPRGPDELLGITGPDQHIVGETGQRIGAFDLNQRIHEALDDAPALGARNEVQYHLGVGGGLADGARAY